MATQPTRRSGRLRTAVPKYTDDVFKAAGIIADSPESESSGIEQDDPSDEDFNTEDGNAPKTAGPGNGASFDGNGPQFILTRLI